MHDLLKKLLLYMIGIVSGLSAFPQIASNSQFISYQIDPKKQDLRFFYKDDNTQPYRSIQKLKEELEQKSQTLVFAMNGGMYMEGNIPLGLYIENGKTIRPLNTRSASGNFYLKPNGVLYLTNEGKAFISTTEKFKASPVIRFATQSGPMLLIDGQVHPSFTKGSSNLNIRNGAGILPNGHILFVISKTWVNFYDMAQYFKDQGCRNALFLDGSVSRMFLPSAQWIETDGDFGVIIGEVRKATIY